MSEQERLPDLNRRQMLAGGVAAGLLGSCETTPSPLGTLTWRKLPTEPFPGKQDDIAFGSARRGWFGNSKGILYRTDDAGDTWNKVWEQPGTFIRALGFIDEDRGIIGNVGVGSFPGVTDTRPLYLTSDGGRSWAPVTEINGPVPAGICAIEVQRSMTIDRGQRAERTFVV